MFTVGRTYLLGYLNRNGSTNLCIRKEDIVSAVKVCSMVQEPGTPSPPNPRKSSWPETPVFSPFSCIFFFYTMNTPKALVLMTLFKSPFHEGEKKAIRKAIRKKNQQFSQCAPTLPMGSIDSPSSSPSLCIPSSISILVESGRAQAEAKPATPNTAASP